MKTRTTRRSARKTPTFADVRKLAAFRAHLTRTQNAIEATKDRAERAALRAKAAALLANIEPLAAFVGR